MNKLHISAIAATLSLAFCTAALAATMSKEQYKTDKREISAAYKSDKSACKSLSGNAQDICKASASGKQTVALAELDAGYKPSPKAHYRMRVAKADADYAVAREQCDDKAGNVKDVCVEEAKAAAVAAKSAAEAQLKTTNANEKAAETSAKAKKEAKEEGREARKDAASDKRDADYAVAKERCDSLASDARTNCMDDAKARYGKS